MPASSAPCKGPACLPGRFPPLPHRFLQAEACIAALMRLPSPEVAGHSVLVWMAEVGLMAQGSIGPGAA